MFLVLYCLTILWHVKKNYSPQWRWLAAVNIYVVVSRLSKYASLTTLTSVGGWDNGSRDFLTSLCKKYWSTREYKQCIISCGDINHNYSHETIFKISTLIQYLKETSLRVESFEDAVDLWFCPNPMENLYNLLWKDGATYATTKDAETCFPRRVIWQRELHHSWFMASAIRSIYT